MPDSKNRARAVAAVGVLCALAAVLQFLEGVLPSVPVPGAKWGLSNLATMAALSLFGLPGALAVTLVKAGFAFLRGGMAGAMSLSGGLLSTLAMAAAARFPRRISFLGTGLAGAMAHNAGQLGAAMVLLSPTLIWYAPPLAAAALVSGTVTGLVMQVVFPRVRSVLEGKI